MLTAKVRSVGIICWTCLETNDLFRRHQNALDASAALATSGALPENVNYTVKSSFLPSFLESVPEVAAKLKEPNTRDRKFEDVVKSVEQAAVRVLVY